MTLSALDGVAWTALMLAPLLLLQRSLHFELQAVFLLITRRPAWAILIFSLIFLPGVSLHELSHFLMARLLRVRTGRVSLTPRAMPDGRLQLGYVETAVTDPLRDALVGAAPLISGGLVVAFIGLMQLQMAPLGERLLELDLSGFLRLLPGLANHADFWLWFYLLFTVSSTMLPSASDRRAWLTVLLVVALLLIVALVAGAGPWMLATLAPPFNRAMRAVAAVVAISAGVHLLLLPPVWMIRKLLNRATGLEVS
jgi:hypothetical protein